MGWRCRAVGAYRQVDFNGMCIGTNWRLVAGGGYTQVGLRADSTVYIYIYIYIILYICILVQYVYL